MVSAASPQKIPRQPRASAAVPKGAPARNAPVEPSRLVSPTRVAKCHGSNQEAKRRIAFTKIAAAPSPTRARPAYTPGRPGAQANRPAPAARHVPLSSKVRRGPQVSARIPEGICRAPYR